jgi:uncharacterized membrane-anchored protein
MLTISISDIHLHSGHILLWFGLFVVDASLFSSTTISVKPVNAIIFSLLILGLRG